MKIIRQQAGYRITLSDSEFEALQLMLVEQREKHRLMGDDEWRTWFAWYPVRVSDGTWVWREIVEFTQPMRYDVPAYRPLHSER